MDQSSIWERGGRCIVGLHLLQIGRCYQELLKFHYLEVRGEESKFIDSLELDKNHEQTAVGWAKVLCPPPSVVGILSPCGRSAELLPVCGPLLSPK